MSRTRNLVAKHSRQFNKAHVMRDRKKDAKRGYRKHQHRHNGNGNEG